MHVICIMYMLWVYTSSFQLYASYACFQFCIFSHCFKPASMLQRVGATVARVEESRVDTNFPPSKWSFHTISHAFHQRCPKWSIPCICYDFHSQDLGRSHNPASLAGTRPILSCSNLRSARLNWWIIRLFWDAKVLVHLGKKLLYST